MRIAFFHELHSGGARRASNEFAKHLKKNNIVDLYFVDEKPNNNEKKFYSSIFYFQFMPKIWKGNNPGARFYKDTIELIKLYKFHKKIAKTIDKNNYDIVFIQGSKFTQAPFILRFLKTKKIYYCQENLRMVYEKILDIDKKLPVHKYFYEKLNRYLRKLIDASNIHHADKVLTNSNYTKENVYKAYGIRAQTCYMGVNTQLFKPEKVAKENDVLYIGAYAIADGYADLEKILAFPHKYKISLLIQERKWIDNDKLLSKLYSKSKIALAMSYNEPFGLIPLEAMACGVPVIAVNEGGYRESIIDGKTGFLVQRDAKKISEKIGYLLGNNNVLKQMSGKCRENILKKWTWKLNAAKLEKILNNFAKDSYE
jgi:glycosyltransferase involved in cell wall biosynthesis